MRRGPNSGPEDQQQKALTLPRSRILRGRQNFDRLFSRHAQVERASAIQFRYRIYEDPDEGCLIGFIVKKKLGTAVKRNRAKRRMRESWRLNQHLLDDLFETKTFGFHGVFMAASTDTPWQTLSAEMVRLIERIRPTLEEIAAKRQPVGNRITDMNREGI